MGRERGDFMENEQGAALDVVGGIPRGGSGDLIFRK